MHSATPHNGGSQKIWNDVQHVGHNVELGLEQSPITRSGMQCKRFYVAFVTNPYPVNGARHRSHRIISKCTQILSIHLILKEMQNWWKNESLRGKRQDFNYIFHYIVELVTNGNFELLIIYTAVLFRSPQNTPVAIYVSKHYQAPLCNGIWRKCTAQNDLYVR